MGSYKYCDCGAGIAEPEIEDIDNDLYFGGMMCSQCGKQEQILSETEWMLKLAQEIQKLKEKE